MPLSHESIAHPIYVVARGALKRRVTTQFKRQGIALLDYPPPEAPALAMPGRFEGDVLKGAQASAVGVLVEHQTRFILLCQLPAKDPATVREVFACKLAALPSQVRLPATDERRHDLLPYARLTASLRLKVCFCRAHRQEEPVYRESQTDRIRFFLPQDLDYSTVSPQKLRAYQDLLNERPRSSLGFVSAAGRMHQLLVANQYSN